MKLLMVFAILLSCSVLLVRSAPADDDVDSKPDSESWWTGFKKQVKTVMAKWREDLKGLWSDLSAKADDMKSWTAEVWDSFKIKMKEWIETRTELPDDKKNEIESFIEKMKYTTDKPLKTIDP